MFRSTVKKIMFGTPKSAPPPATPFVSGTQPAVEDATASKPKKPKNFYQK
jgi:hypothetical protein